MGKFCSNLGQLKNLPADSEIELSVPLGGDPMIRLLLTPSSVKSLLLTDKRKHTCGNSFNRRHRQISRMNTSSLSAIQRLRQIAAWFQLRHNDWETNFTPFPKSDFADFCMDEKTHLPAKAQSKQLAELGPEVQQLCCLLHVKPTLNSRTTDRTYSLNLHWLLYLVEKQRRSHEVTQAGTWVA